MAIAEEYPDVELSHMYVDNAAMQLVRYPKQVCLWNTPACSVFHFNYTLWRKIVRRIKLQYSNVSLNPAV